MTTLVCFRTVATGRRIQSLADQVAEELGKFGIVLVAQDLTTGRIYAASNVGFDGPTYLVEQALLSLRERCGTTEEAE